MSTERLLAIATIVFGLAAFAALLWFNMLPEVGNAYPYGAFGAAMSAFQRAATIDDLAAIFGNPPDLTTVAAMTAANKFDLFVFIPAYMLFLIAAGVMLVGDIKRPEAWIAILIAVIAGIADVMETAAQLGVTAEWSSAQRYLPSIAPAAWMKFFALAVQGLVCTLICYKSERKRPIIGALGVLPMLGVLAAATNLVQIPALMTSVFGIFWIGLIVVAVLELMRPAPAPSATP